MVRYGDKKQAVKDELLRFARKGATTTYGELGRSVGIPPQGPWKPLLDEISQEETVNGRPDITFLVLNKGTGFPGQIGFVRAGQPSHEQIGMARRTLNAVFDTYAPKQPL